jgi:uncharacterized protein YqeY
MAKSETAQRLQQDTVAAMKARDRERLGILRMLQAAIKQVEVDERRELAEADVLKVLSTYARKVKDQIAAARESGRADLLEQAEGELAVVSGYLPAELSDSELEQLVREAVAASGATGPRDMGKVMKAVMPQVAGRADGGRVSALVKRLLSG